MFDSRLHNMRRLRSLRGFCTKRNFYLYLEVTRDYCVIGMCKLEGPQRRPSFSTAHELPSRTYFARETPEAQTAAT